MIEPRNPVFEFSSVIRNGGSEASAKAYTVPSKSGATSAKTLRTQR